MVTYRGPVGAGLMLLAIVGLCASTAPAAARATGSIEGRVVNGATDRPQPGVRVVLTAGTADGDDTFTRRAVTDARGRYRFPSLATGEEHFYTLDALFDGGIFAGGAVTLPDDTRVRPVIDTTLRVWPTTRDPSAIAFRSDRSFVVPSETSATVIHSVTVANLTERAYIGRAARASGTRVTLGLPLPSGATNVAIVDAEIDIPELVPMSNGAGVTIAIPPGDTRVSYSYSLAGSAGNYELSRPALYPTLELAVFTQDPLEISSNRLEPRGQVTISGETYREWRSTEKLEAGDPLQAIAIARADVPVAPIAGGAVAVAVLVAGIVLWRRRTPSAAVATR